MTATRPLAIAASVLATAALTAWAVHPRLSARLTGEEYRLAVAPVDPIDPFRGAYVALTYPGLPESEFSQERVYVPLVRDGGLWKGGPITTDRPSGPHLSCRAPGWGSLDCGIDSLFVSESRARRLERPVAAGRLAALLRIDSTGHAAVVRLVPRP